MTEFSCCTIDGLWIESSEVHLKGSRGIIPRNFRISSFENVNSFCFRHYDAIVVMLLFISMPLTNSRENKVTEST